MVFTGAVFTAILVAFLSCVYSTSLISDQLSVYRNILSAVNPAWSEKVTVEGLKTLLAMHDDDAQCGDLCEEYLKERMGGNEVSWGVFETIVTTLYGDMISADPYEPTEIKLALGETSDIMKVMFITFMPLDDPFVEFCLSEADDNWMRVPAPGFTYTVPQKWWPVFTGMIYEADMTGLAPATRYIYRVGGYDSANSTTRYSPQFEFSSAPAPDPARQTTVGVLADQGTFMLLGFMVADKLAEMQDELGIDFTMYATRFRSDSIFTRISSFYVGL